MRAMAKTPDNHGAPIHGPILGIAGSLMVFFGIVMMANATPTNLGLGPMIFQSGMLFIAAALVVGALRRR